MNVLLLGATGYMGPHVVRELAGRHRLRITDIQPATPEMLQEFRQHEFRDVDITDWEQVHAATEGMDAVINLAVVRRDPLLAFQVNVLGCYHVMRSAAERKIARVVNSGPHFAIAGPRYEYWDYGITPDAPPHPGVGLYPLSKSLGQDICRSYSDARDVHVVELLFFLLQDEEQLNSLSGGPPFVVSWYDCGVAFRLALEVAAERLPSRCEAFFILGDTPHHKFLNDKAKRILGFAPRDDVTRLWRKRP